MGIIIYVEEISRYLKRKCLGKFREKKSRI